MSLPFYIYLLRRGENCILVLLNDLYTAKQIKERRTLYTSIC